MQIERAGGVLVALSADKPEDVTRLKRRLGLTFPVLSDASLKVAAAYGVRQGDKGLALPALFVVGEDGRIVWRKVGDALPDRPTLDEIFAQLPRPHARAAASATPARQALACATALHGVVVAHWTLPPPPSDGQGKIRFVRARVEVGRDGSTGEVKLVQASGHADVDRSVVEAIQKAGRDEGSRRSLVRSCKLPRRLTLHLVTPKR